MIREKCVPVHKVKVTLIGMRKALAQTLDFFRRIKTQEITEPSLDRVVVPISDRLFELDFFKLSAGIRLPM